jgi:hypothetical protein
MGPVGYVADAALGLVAIDLVSGHRVVVSR